MGGQAITSSCGIYFFDGDLKIKCKIPIATREPSASAMKSAISGLRFVGSTNCKNSTSNP